MRISGSKKTDTKDQKINYEGSNTPNAGKLFNPEKTTEGWSDEEYKRDADELTAILMDAMTKPVDSADPAPDGYMECLQIDPPEVNLYLVGGAVREIVRGFPERVNDWDFAIEAPSFDYMRSWIEAQGFEIFLETPQYFTIRARSSKHFTFAGMDMSGRTFDFTLCRTESDYTDGRRPDNVAPGTIEQDLARRDFTMNAMAMDKDGNIIDPFDGRKDIFCGAIRCVGGTDRFVEDYLRVIRAVRFSIQLGFHIAHDEHWFIAKGVKSNLLSTISEDRVRDELTKCFKINTKDAFVRWSYYGLLMNEIFDAYPSLWLMPTTKGK